MKGSLSYLSIHRPLIYEITNDNLQRFTMTNPHGWETYGTVTISSYSLFRTIPDHPIPLISFVRNLNEVNSQLCVGSVGAASLSQLLTSTTNLVIRNAGEFDLNMENQGLRRQIAGC